MTSLEIIRLLIDFGLVVLIWMIQRIVYPSFLQYSLEKLVIWHKEYTTRFSSIVIPLMFGQLGISLYQVIEQASIFSIVSLGIIVLVWISTFVQFVPLHAKISEGIVNESMLKALVQKNWLRTFLWSVLFILNCLVTFPL